MRIECAYNKIVLLRDLKPHPANRNKHPEKQIRALAKIIARNGQRSPIVVSNLSGCIVKGHGRYEALKMLGWESCAVDYQDYKDESEEFRDRIADNEVARYGEFDRDGFLEDIKSIGDVDLDFEEFGLIDFKFSPILTEDDLEVEKIKEDLNKKYILEITFPNDMEMMDIHDDLTNRGYIVKIK
jgi:hypothetical protein